MGGITNHSRHVRYRIPECEERYETVKRHESALARMSRDDSYRIELPVVIRQPLIEVEDYAAQS
jgi:hypothetical protein